MLAQALRRTPLITLFALLACHGHGCEILSCQPEFRLPYNKPVYMLERPEVIHLCETLDLQQTPDQLCTAMAAQRTTDPAQCAVMQTNCIQGGPVKQSCYGEDFAEALASCEEDITVGFFKTCFEEQIRAANALDCLEPPGRRLIPPHCVVRLAEHCDNMFQ